MTTPHIKLNSRSSFRLGSILITFALACFALSATVRAVDPPHTPDPPPLPISNTADGQLALAGLTTGLYNSAFGIYALLSNGAAKFNTGVGADVLLSNTADKQTAVGTATLFSNTTGANNTGCGTFALFTNTTGGFNNAVGANSLLNNVDGSFNNALGESALFNNIHASANTAIGDAALAFNDSDAAGLANNNTGVGAEALFNNVDGSENTAVGTGSGQNLITGFNNTYVGDFVGSLAPDESSTIRIGDLSNGNGAGSLECFIGGIFNNFQPVGGSVVEVTLDLANDHLGWDVGPSQGGSVPSAPQRGAPVPRSAPLRPYARPQHQAMLNDKVEKLQATVAQQQKQIETLTAQLREQAAQIQMVSAQIELSKSAPQTVLNNH
jgi:hypothetical protein